MQKIKYKIIIPVLSSLFIFLFASIAGFYSVKKENLNRKITSLMSKTNNLYLEKVSREAVSFNRLIRQIETRGEILSAWMRRDRNLLYERTKNIYTVLNSEFGITGLSFINPDKKCFLRVHNHNRYGDLINMFTLKHAVILKKTGYGVELDSIGSYSLRVVTPVSVNGKLAGYIELDAEIEQILHYIKKVLDVEIVISIKKSLLKKKLWEEGLILSGKKGRWNLLKEFAIIDRTLAFFPENLEFYYRHISDSKKPETLTINNEIKYNKQLYRGGFVPLIDAGNRHIGYLFVLSDITEDIASINNLAFYLIAFSLLFGFAIFLFLYIYTGKIEKRMEQTENELNNAKKEEEHFKQTKIEALGVFAGGIAHDFNSLLTVITGNLSLAITGIHKNHEIYDVLNEAETASNKAKELTKQLLAFSKGGNPKRKRISVSKMINEFADMVLSGNEIEKKIDIPDNLYRIFADKVQIYRAFYNIILNARQAINGRGLLTITAANIDPAKDSPVKEITGPCVKISIADTGSGIKNEIIERIYDPYFTKKENSTGLGLTVAHSIIKNHNGLIDVKSEMNKGTVFTVYLPASREEQKTKVPETGTVDLNNCRVLLLDDEDMILKVGARMLEKLGCKVECAKDGKDAVFEYKRADLHEKKFNAVILDLSIPGGMGGQETFEVLKKYDPDVTAIVSSGYSNDQFMNNYKEYGYKGVIAKPYRIDELKEVLNSVLAKTE
jgi:signal transduction histidine kinase/CheY-like chemotaxis protein